MDFGDVYLLEPELIIIREGERKKEYVIWFICWKFYNKKNSGHIKMAFKMAKKNSILFCYFDVYVVVVESKNLTMNSFYSWN